MTAVETSTCAIQLALEASVPILDAEFLAVGDDNQPLQWRNSNNTAYWKMEIRGAMVAMVVRMTFTCKHWGMMRMPMATVTRSRRWGIEMVPLAATVVAGPAAHVGESHREWSVSWPIVTLF